MKITKGKLSLSGIKEKLGPLWWYALIIFIVQRLGDVLNAAAGVWLIPKYVPIEELGALEPLTKVGAMLGLPLAIVVAPYIKLLNTHATRGEFGKVKSLLRDALAFCTVASVLTITAGAIMMPRIFTFVRVENGRLALLIIATSIIGTVTPIFNGSLQALKRFRTYSAISLLAAPIRFVTLLIALPFRGLTGYFAGQASGSLLTIGIASVDLIRRFGRKIKCEPYWKEDKNKFLLFLIPGILSGTTGTVRATLEMMMIRSLPDIESAAFYLLTRFSEIATYIVSPLIFVLFPIISERHELGKNTHRMLFQTLAFTLGIGGITAIGLAVSGSKLFSLSATWQPYIPYTGQMGILTLMATIRLAMACFTTHEIACWRFKFFRYTIPIAIIESAIIYIAFHYPEHSGYGNWQLKNVLLFFFAFTILPLSLAFIQLSRRLLQRKKNGSSLESG